MFKHFTQSVQRQMNSFHMCNIECRWKLQGFVLHSRLVRFTIWSTSYSASEESDDPLRLWLDNFL